MKKILAVLALLAVSSVHAATFNLFQPASGILKGNPSTYITTAAASSDVIALWTGTCNSTTFLRADGSCQVVSGGGGTVSSVALTMPSGFSVGGSPVTTSGTLAVTTALSGVLKGTGSGFTTSTSTDILGLWTGTCNSGTFLRGDGSCQAAGGGSLANPTGLIGMTAANGVAATGTRSDGTHAINPAIAPTWTGVHTYSNHTLFNDYTLTSMAGAGATAFQYWQDTTAATDEKNWAANIDTGTFCFGAADDALNFNNGALCVTRGTGATVVGVELQNGAGTERIEVSDVTGVDFVTAIGVTTQGVAGGPQGAGTINAGGLFVNGSPVGGTATTGSFTGTLTGMTAGCTGTVNYSVTNGIATLWAIANILCTSNTTAMTMTGLPAAVQPTHSIFPLGAGVESSGNAGLIAGHLLTNGSGTMTMQLCTPAIVQCGSGSWASSGTKGIQAGWTINYPL